MKRLMMIMVTLFATANFAWSMSYEQAREQALFLTDKMAYELNLNESQYEAAYEVNLDYLMGINSYNDVSGVYWANRNADLRYILLDWQYTRFMNSLYFYRPIYWDAGFWHFRIYSYYPRRDFFYYTRPTFYVSYRGGHSWRSNGGRSWYHGRSFSGTRHHGMRDAFDRGNYHRGNYNNRGGNNFNRGNNGNRGFNRGNNGFNNGKNGGSFNGDRDKGGNRGFTINRGNNGKLGTASKDDVFRRSDRSVDSRLQRGGSVTPRSAMEGSSVERPSRSFGNSRSAAADFNRSTSTPVSRPSSFGRGSSAGGSRPSSSFDRGSSSMSSGRSNFQSSPSRSSSFGSGSRGGGNSGGGSRGGGGHFGGRR